MRDTNSTNPLPWPAVTIEFVATTLFLFLVSTAVQAANGNWVVIALAFGGSVAILIAVFTHHSGAHMNPAVTLALYITKRLEGRTAIAYIAGQMAGGLLGTFLASLVQPAGSELTTVATVFVRDLNPVAGLFIEVLLTFILVLVIFAVSVDHRNDTRFAPLAIGLTVMVAVLAGGPYTGAALNPARWFGPAVMQGEWANLTAYTAGPFIGAMLGGLVYQQFLMPKDEATVSTVASLDSEEE
jgi:MIP family channel proteins